MLSLIGATEDWDRAVLGHRLPRVCYSTKGKTIRAETVWFRRSVSLSWSLGREWQNELGNLHWLSSCSQISHSTLCHTILSCNASHMLTKHDNTFSVVSSSVLLDNPVSYDQIPASRTQNELNRTMGIVSKWSLLVQHYSHVFKTTSI